MPSNDPKLPLSDAQALTLDVFTFVDEVQQWAEAIEGSDWQRAKRHLDGVANEAALLALNDRFEAAWNETSMPPDMPEHAANLQRFLAAVAKIVQQS